MSMSFAPIGALVGAIASGQTTASAVLEAHLSRIAVIDPQIGAYVRLDVEGARAQAAAVDVKRDNGAPLGALAGVPIGLKDVFCTDGVETTGASRILEGFVPPYDATVVARLRAADAVLVGKLNLDELAMGSSTEQSAVQRTHNPWDLSRVPGGSSGGSAAAVAARLCAGALGTDTGGSIRQPAAFCGVVGFKPSYGRLSRYGVFAFASSLDQPGPMARTVRGVARLYDAMVGPDPRDVTTRAAPAAALTPGLRQSDRLDGLRIGIPRPYLEAAALSGEVRALVQQAVSVLETLGAQTVEVELPHTHHALAVYYIIATAEASSNLARYDGVRFGRRAECTDLESLYMRSRGEGFGPEVKRRIMLGTFVLSAGHRDAYYRKASQVRTLIKRDFDRAFETVDLVVSPTAPSTAFPMGTHRDDPTAMYHADIFTLPCSLAGLPGLSVPCGFDAGGLPVGLQVIGRSLDEATVLRVGAAYEDATEWGERRPMGLEGL